MILVLRGLSSLCVRLISMCDSLLNACLYSRSKASVEIKARDKDDYIIILFKKLRFDLNTFHLQIYVFTIINILFAAGHKGQEHNVSVHAPVSTLS